MKEEPKKEEVTFLARMDFGITPIKDTLIIDCKGQGGSASSNDAFFEGMLTGMIIGSAIN